MEWGGGWSGGGGGIVETQCPHLDSNVDGLEYLSPAAAAVRAGGGGPHLLAVREPHDNVPAVVLYRGRLAAGQALPEKQSYSVADPDPSDPYDFGPPGSGSGSSS